jgi:hypothetical protein
MQWPRDADRLPNGHTLVADTNTGRLLEVDRNGSVVWSMENVPGNYDVERLNTGDESAGGPSATKAGLADTDSETGYDDWYTDSTLRNSFGSLLPAILVNALMYVTPGWWNWFGLDGFATFVLGISVVGAVAVRLPPVEIRSPIIRRRR